MHTGGFCSQRDEEGPWDNVRLYPADYVRNATTDAGHQGLAANRPAGCGVVQGAGSELWKGCQGEDAPVGHVDSRLRVRLKPRDSGGEARQCIPDICAPTY
jgi:hypothetical protein